MPENTNPEDDLFEDPDGRYLVGWERSDRKVTFLPRRLESPRIWLAATLAEFDVEREHGQPAGELR